jgi:hypothetical protein
MSSYDLSGFGADQSDMMSRLWGGDLFLLRNASQQKQRNSCSDEIADGSASGHRVDDVQRIPFFVNTEHDRREHKECSYRVNYKPATLPTQKG